MANSTKFLDWAGLQDYHSRIKSYIDDQDDALATDIAGKQATLTQTQLNAVNSGITSSKVSGYDSHLSNTTVHITSSERTTWNAKVSGSSLTQAKIIVGGGSNSVSASSYSVDDILAVANGRTSTYVISKATATGHQNASFNTGDAAVTITGDSKTLKLYNGDNVTVALSALKIGDIILVTDVDVPDRWVSSISGTGSSAVYTFNKMETAKVPIEDYVAKSVIGTKGDLLYGTGSNNVSALAIGSTGKVLKVSSSGIPAWETEYSYTLPAATSSALGGIKLFTNGDSTLPTGKNYAVLLDGNNKAYVYVPWDDNTNTSHDHAAGDGISISGTAGISGGTVTYSVKVKSVTAGTSGLTVDSSGLYVNYGNGLTNSNGSTAGGSLIVKASNGISVTSSGVAVSPKSNGGISVDSTGVGVVVKSNGGITLDSNGLSLTTGQAPTAASGYTNAAVQLSSGVPYVAVPLTDPESIPLTGTDSIASLFA